MKYDIEQLLEAGEIIQIYPEGYSMYPMFVPGRDAAVIRENDECHYDVLADQRDFDRICAEWTSYQREKSGLCDLVRIVADVSAGEMDILVIYCMGAPAA